MMALWLIGIAACAGIGWWVGLTVTEHVVRNDDPEAEAVGGLTGLIVACVLWYLLVPVPA